MSVRFIKADPSGNSTVFILDPVPPSAAPALATEIMASHSVGAEQVAFVRPAALPGAAARMEMAGGEFCGNATRSFGALLAMGGLSDCGLSPFTGTAQIPVEVSGCPDMLTVTVSGDSGGYRCSAAVDMPRPERVLHGQMPVLGSYSLVCFDGVIHLVLWEREGDLSLLAPARELLAEEDCPDTCFGILFTNQKLCTMTPLVYVKAIDSLIWESSCGSGTVAVACALAHRERRAVPRMLWKQPGGTLAVSVGWTDGTYSTPVLSGDIAFTAAGVLYPKETIEM